MKTIMLTLLLVLPSSFCFGQVFNIDELKQQGILLDKNWKWHAGDNPDFAKPDFDDSKWESIDPTKEVTSFPKFQEAEIGYLRLHISVDSSLFNKAMALKIWQMGAVEIFLNGKLIHKIGTVSKNPAIENTYMTNGFPYSVTFDKLGPQIIAVRYSMTKSNILLKYRTIDFNTFRIIIAPLEETIFTYSKIINAYSLIGYGKLGILLFLGILHLFFFVAYRKQNANFFISLYALCQAYNYHLDNENSLLISYKTFYFNTNLFIVLAILSRIFSLFTVYSYLKLPRGFAFWVLTFLIIIGYPICLLLPMWGWFYFWFILIGILAFEIIRIALRKNQQNILGTKYIIGGWISYIFFMGIFILMVFGALPTNEIIGITCLNLGQLSVPISYSIMLAGDNARTNRILVSKLSEVEILHNEKQQILASQNETLEKQVKERTTELQHSLENLKATQKQLIQSEKLASLGELTAGIAHEIQNPLNFVNNFSDLSVELAKELKDEVEKPEMDKALILELANDLSENQEKITHHGKRASSIVKGMLEHSRTSTGIKELTDINKMADEFLRLAYHGLRAKDGTFNATLETNFDENLPKIEVIPQDIGRVLLNLISNAFYATKSPLTPEGGTKKVPIVLIKTEQILDKNSPFGGRGAIVISIKDNGTGMSEETKGKIFQPFFTTKPTGEGTGLGLSLAYDIVTKGHGGTIDCESVEGEGTTFIVKLPIS
jgi:two-component system, NtrC family, sensor kinase